MNKEVQAIILENIRTVPMTPFERDLQAAAAGVKVIFKRGDKYLQVNHYWGEFPYAFEWWESDRLQALFYKWGDPPTHYAWVTGDSVDLDAVEWTAI